VIESAPEPVVGDLAAAKKVEEYAAQFEVAPVITNPGVEVGAASIGSGGERLKAPVVSSQEEPAEDSVVDVTEVPPVLKEDALLPATNGSGHPSMGLVGPVEGVTEAVVPEVWGGYCSLTCALWLT